MTDDFSNPARRAALARQAERLRDLNRSGREFAEMTDTEKFERHAAAMEARYGVRNAAGDAFARHYDNAPLRTGAQPAQDKEARKLAADAAMFQENPRMERLLKWEKADDPRFDKLDPSERMALGFYRRQKDAAKAVRRG